MEENEGLGQETESTESLNPSTEPQGEPSILDLDSVDKFKFGGREWTPKEFQGAYMAQADYTRKTQALAEERKYYDNLLADLDNVKKNPTLADKFKQVYPQKFHNYLGTVTPAQAEKLQAQAQGTAQTPEYAQLLDRLDRIEKESFEKQVSAIQSELDTKFEALGKKYPFASEDEVLAKATALVDRLTKEHGPDAKVSDSHLEALFKASNEKVSKLAEKHYSSLVKGQKQANVRGKDAGSGGQLPGQAPKQPRTLSEAREAFLQESSQGG